MAARRIIVDGSSKVIRARMVCGKMNLVTDQNATYEASVLCMHLPIKAEDLMH